MKRYKAYKDSGVEWIGEVPSNWSIKRLKNLVKVPLKYGANEAADEDDPSNPRYIRITDFGNDGKLRDDTFKSLKEEIAQDFLLEDGDLLFARSGATVGKTFLFSGFKGKACYAGYLIKASFPRHLVESRFVNYVTKSQYYENWKQSVFQQATIQNIGADKYNLFNVPIPNAIEEQTQIANYLDYKTAQIDTLIEKKERLIALLEEERTSLINEVVTGKKVWNGTEWTKPTETKDSGIEWLGEIPKEWEVSKIKHIAKVQGRLGFKGYTVQDLVDEGQGPYTLGAKHISKRNLLDLSKPDFISWDKYYESPEIMVHLGDVLLTQRGTLGKVVIIEDEIGEATINPSMVLLNQLRVDNKFLYYFFSSSFFHNWIDLTNTATAVPMISQEQLKNFSILLPRNEEQRIIVDFLDNSLGELDNLLQMKQNQITLLKEYKTALISEVVTGKIDVRDEVIPSNKVLESVN